MFCRKLRVLISSVVLVKTLSLGLISSSVIGTAMYSNNAQAAMSCSNVCGVTQCTVVGTRPPKVRPPLIPLPPLPPPRPPIFPYPPTSPPPNKNSVCGGNPVELATGVKIQHEQDLKINGSELSFSRTYLQSNSKRGMHGYKWVSAFDIKLTFIEGIDNIIEVHTASGETLLATGQGAYWVLGEGLGIISKNEDHQYVWYKPDGNLEVYDQFGRIVSIEYANGQYWIFTHQHWMAKKGDPFTVERSRLRKAEFSSGASFSFKYDFQGLLLAVSDHNNNEYLYTYTDSKLLNSVQTPEGTKREYLYQDNRHPDALTQININGEMFAYWQYDEQGRAISSEHAGGVDKHLFAYNENGSTTLTNPLGKETTYYFDIINNKRVLSRVEGNQSAYCAASYKSTEYDSFGFDDKVTDWKGNVTDYDYNSRGQVEKVTSGFGTENAVTVQTKWHSYFNLPVEERTLTTQASYEYSDKLHIVKKTISGLNSGLSRTWHYNRTFHTSGQIKTETVNGPQMGDEDIAISTFDDKGNLLTVTNAYGRSVQYGHYNQFSQPGYQTDANGVFTEFKYDVKGRLISQTEYLETPRVTRFTYNAFDQIVDTTLPDGNRVQYSYDNAYRKVAEIDVDGSQTELTLDDAGNVIKSTTTDAVTRIKGQVFDGLSQVRQMSHNGVVKTIFDYDAGGNIISETDALGNKVLYDYDALNRKITETHANGETTHYRYNHQNKLIQVIDANGNSTHYEYNDFGEVIKLISPDSGITTYKYDIAGNRVSEKHQDGNQVRLTYDLLDRVVSKHFVSATGSQSIQQFEYDQCDYGTGMLCKVIDSSGVTEYDYDASGNRYREIVSIGRHQYITQRRFDIMDRLIEEAYPSGNKVTYQRGEAGKIKQVLLNDQLVISDIEYDQQKMISWRFSNGQSVIRDFDLQGRLVNINAGDALKLNFTYSANDNITQIESALSTLPEQYVYDELSRLVQENDTRYEYDALGNRQEQSNAMTSLRYGYNTESNRLLQVNEQRLKYDTQGNVIQFAEKLYFYNAENRLSQFKEGNTAASYSYNFLRQRVAKQVNNQSVEHFTYDQGGKHLGRYQESEYREYIFLDGMPLILVDGKINRSQTTLSYVVSDQLGRPEVATDQEGMVVWQADNSAFNRDILVAKVVINLGFPGQYYDQEKDSWYNWHRDYDANLGRYLQSDPIGIKGGLNTYLYAGANGMSFYDFTGMAPCGCQGTSSNKKSNSENFRVGVIRNALNKIGKGGEAAEKLVLFTAIHESGLIHRRQIGGGPGRGLFQIETTTHLDIQRYLNDVASSSLKKAVNSLKTQGKTDSWNLEFNDAYGAALARIRYTWTKDSIPSTNDLKKMSEYWGRYYNTRNEPAKNAKFVRDIQNCYN